MNVRFADRLETEARFHGERPPDVVKAFHKRMQLIRSAVDERAFRELKSLHFEKLRGARSHQYSMRLNDQLRLIVELENQGRAKTVVIVSVEDYH